MILGSDVQVGDLIRLKSGKNRSYGIIVDWSRRVEVLIGNRFTYVAMVDGQRLELIRDAFDVVRELEVKPLAGSKKYSGRQKTRNK